MRNYWNQNRQNYNNAIDNFFESMVSQINVEILVAHLNTAFGDDGKNPTNRRDKVNNMIKQAFKRNSDLNKKISFRKFVKRSQ